MINLTKPIASDGWACHVSGAIHLSNQAKGISCWSLLMFRWRWIYLQTHTHTNNERDKTFSGKTNTTYNWPLLWVHQQMHASSSSSSFNSPLPLNAVAHSGHNRSQLPCAPFVYPLECHFYCPQKRLEFPIFPSKERHFKFSEWQQQINQCHVWCNQKKIRPKKKRERVDFHLKIERKKTQDGYFWGDELTWKSGLTSLISSMHIFTTSYDFSSSSA